MERIYPRMLAWREGPADPDRPLLSNPHVQSLAVEIAPGSQLTDLGGTFSLNLGLAEAGLVLRVHQPFVSRARLLAVQTMRQRLADRRLIIPVALPWRGSQFSTAGADGPSWRRTFRTRSPRRHQLPTSGCTARWDPCTAAWRRLTCPFRVPSSRPGRPQAPSGAGFQSPRPPCRRTPRRRI